MYVPVPQKLIFSEKFLAQKRLCLSMWDGCRFNQPAMNFLISNNKVVTGTVVVIKV